MSLYFVNLKILRQFSHLFDGWNQIKSIKQPLNKPLTCWTSSGPQAPWHCGPGTSWSQWATCTLSSCCYHNRCLASASDPWTSCGPCCQYLWAYASFSVQRKDGFITNAAKPTQAGSLKLTKSSYRNLYISVRLMANKLLGALFDDLGFCEGPEGCHGDCGHKNIQSSETGLMEGWLSMTP